MAVTFCKDTCAYLLRVTNAQKQHFREHLHTRRISHVPTCELLYGSLISVPPIVNLMRYIFHNMG